MLAYLAVGAALTPAQRPGDHHEDSFIAQSDDGIDAHGATGRDEAGG